MMAYREEKLSFKPCSDMNVNESSHLKPTKAEYCNYGAADDEQLMWNNIKRRRKRKKPKNRDMRRRSSIFFVFFLHYVLTYVSSGFNQCTDWEERGKVRVRCRHNERLTFPSYGIDLCMKPLPRLAESDPKLSQSVTDFFMHCLLNRYLLSWIAACGCTHIHYIGHAHVTISGEGY